MWSSMSPLLLLVLLVVSMAPATLTAMMTVKRAAVKGETVTLSCPRKMDKTDDQVMQWIKGRDVIFEDDGMIMSEKWNSDKFDLSAENPSHYNLTINSVTKEDKDSYFCRLYDMDTDEVTKFYEYELLVLEKPTCEDGSNKLVRGQSYDFNCKTDINDAQLLWRDGTAEGTVGKNLVKPEVDTTLTYRTTKTLIGEAKYQGKSVECELQHPDWSADKERLACSFGVMSVENAVLITCDEDKQKGESVVCQVKKRDEQADSIDAADIKFVLEGQPLADAKPVATNMIEPLADGSGFQVSLTSSATGQNHAIVVGEDVGPWQKMPLKPKIDHPDEEKKSSMTGVIVVIVIIALLLVAIVVLVVLWKRKIIFSASKSKEADAEKGAPKLNGVTYNNGGVNGTATNGVNADEKTLLDNKCDSQVDAENKKNNDERRSSNASSEDDKKLIIDSDSGKTKNSDDGI